MLAGKVAILQDADRPGERTIGVHGERRFVGELNLLTGEAAYLTARVIASGEVLQISRERSHEHICWDQATVLVQAGLLEPSGLPVVGSEQAEALLDQGRPKNELFAGDG